MISRILVLGVALFVGQFKPSLAATPEAQYSIGGWTEAVVSVRNLDEYHAFFVDIAQWGLLGSGDVSDEQIEAWQLPVGAKAKYRLYGNPGTKSGLIRLIQFSGVEQVPIRLDSQSWDTGGIFDINVRIKNLSEVARKVRAIGWQARAPITQFSFGPFVVKEWIVQSSDGLAIAMIERLQPKLEGWPHMKSMSRTFNSTQVVVSMEKNLRFYEEVLGFKRYLEHKGASEKPGANVLGLPHNITTKVPREIVILHPEGTNEGSVELLSFEGAVGSNFASRAKMPNFGIVALRFPVKNLTALQQKFKSEQTAFVHLLRKIDQSLRVTVSSPEGAWLEFYEINEY